jgi:FKBP-type peptidyl-prolyl cis-trans isomerase FklB
LKNRKSFFLVCLVFTAMIAAWGMNRDVHAQSQPDTGPPSEQEGQAPPDNPEGHPLFKTQKDRMNYAIGVSLIGNFKKQGVDIDLNLVMKGMQDAFAGEKLLLSDGELGRALKLYYVEARQQQARTMARTAEENKKEGEAFLAENKKKKGVVTLPSGLQYRIIQEGKGKKPAADDTVEVHYQGTLINGTEFDSSYRTGTPSTFKVKDVIPGWREALQRMPVGSTWQIFVPSSLAYGEKGTNGPIGPNATLIFEVKLLAIK